MILSIKKRPAMGRSLKQRIYIGFRRHSVVPVTVILFDIVVVVVRPCIIIETITLNAQRFCIYNVNVIIVIVKANRRIFVR